MVNYRTTAYAAALVAGMVVGNAYADDTTFKKGNIAENARTLAPMLLDSKFNVPRLGGKLYMDPVRLKKSWSDKNKGKHPALSLYDTAPFGEINEGDILSILVYDNKKVSGRASIDAFTGRIIDVKGAKVNYGKVLDDILKEKLKLDIDNDSNKEGNGARHIS